MPKKSTQANASTTAAEKRPSSKRKPKPAEKRADAPHNTAASGHLMEPNALKQQATLLQDGRFSSAQRQALAARMGRVGGNRYLQRVIDQRKGDQVVARQPAVAEEETTEQPHLPFPPFGNLTTFAQLAGAARFGIGQIQADLRDAPSGHPVHARATEWSDGVEGWLPYLDSQGDAPLTAPVVGQAELHLEEGTAIREAIAEAKRAEIRREMDRVAARARAAAREAERLQPRLADSLRAAYRSGDSDLIGDIASTMGSMVDIGMGLHELARESAEAVASLVDVDLPAVGRYVQALDRLNRGLAIFNLVYSATQTEATTQMEEAMRQLSVATGAFSSLATIAGLPAHMGLYANLYLVPMTNAIMAGISRLTSLLQEENDIWTEIFGEPLRYGVEPGGRPMWRFMVAAMHASRFTEVPAIDEEVADYLLEHRSALEAGAGEAVPTEGWWFWRELDTDRAQLWIYSNRDRVWAMFYGSRSVPD